MREVFEAFLTDPVRINEEVYALWLEGHNANDALAVRLSARPHEPPIVGDAMKTQELLWRDTVDQYRLFEKLEHYLMHPSLFRSQLLFQIPPLQQHHMIERYYSLDGHVARWLVGRKLSAKIQKDLDEISEQSQLTLKSCRRQLQNLQRVYSAIEDRNFQGMACQSVRDLFSISDKLASKYACVLFLLHGRFEVHPTHRLAGFLTWQDLLFISAVIMVHWIPQRRVAPQLLRNRSGDPAAGVSTTIASTPSTMTSRTKSGDAAVSSAVMPPPPVLIPQISSRGAEECAADIALRATGEDHVWPSIAVLQDRLVPMSVRATMGLDLSHNLTNCLRDLKAHLINDNETLAVYRQHVMAQLRAIYGDPDMQELTVKLYLVVHGFLTIGAGLSQPKELKDLLGNLVSMVVRVLKDCHIQRAQLDDVFSALIDALPRLDVWYLNGHETRHTLLASWERFLSVCRIIILVMFDRVDLSQL
ncbi:hypothetical protein PINS_up010737 [Pythium insidiosum]|nr:hypothetical protein PINS_up010737 [Pythium insidiosum]